MSETSVPPNARPAHPSRARRAHALAGALGGMLGGALAGGLGSTLGLCIVDMAPPQWGTLLPNVLDGILAWGLAAGAAGALAGVVIGERRGRRAAFVWTCAAAFWSVLVGAVEA